MCSLKLLTFYEPCCWKTLFVDLNHEGGRQNPSQGPLFWTPRQFLFGVMGLFFGPLGQFLVISWKQKRCATSVRSFWRRYQAISSHMDPFQTNFDANKHSQISRRRRRQRRRRTNSQIPTWPLSTRTQGSNASQGPLMGPSDTLQSPLRILI